MAAPRPGDLQEAAKGPVLAPKPRWPRRVSSSPRASWRPWRRPNRRSKHTGRLRQNTRALYRDLGAQDTYYVVAIKGVGRIYQQTFIDTYSRVATAKLYTDKSAITAADLLNYRVVPLFDDQGIKLQRILTDRGTEYCLKQRGKPENHAYQLYLAVEDVDHSRTKANHPQTNGICERFHKTLQDECCSLLFRK